MVPAAAEPYEGVQKEVLADQSARKFFTADGEAGLAGAASPAVRPGLGMILSTSSMRVVEVDPRGKPARGGVL